VVAMMGLPILLAIATWWWWPRTHESGHHAADAPAPP